MAIKVKKILMEKTIKAMDCMAIKENRGKTRNSERTLGLILRSRYAGCIRSLQSRRVSMQVEASVTSLE